MPEEFDRGELGKGNAVVRIQRSKIVHALCVADARGGLSAPLRASDIDGPVRSEGFLKNIVEYTGYVVHR